MGGLCLTRPRPRGPLNWGLSLEALGGVSALTPPYEGLGLEAPGRGIDLGGLEVETPG